MRSFEKLLIRSSIYLVLLSLVATFSCQAQTEQQWVSALPTFEAKPPELLKGPYLQNVKVDGITVMWESEQPMRGKVIFGKEDLGENEVAETDSATIHEVILTDLDIETVYQYQVVSGGEKSAIYTFKTAVKKGSPFSFAVYGDNKKGPFNYQQVAKLISSKQPHFVIHNGDFVDRGYIYKQWEKLFFSPAQEMISHIPLFPAIGNHEEQAKLFYDYFSMPNNEKWYSFDFGNAHIVILDSDEEFLEEDGEQIKWLVDDLEKNTATWTFVNFHHPPFTAGGNYYKKDRIMRKNLLHPVFEKYGVDMVLSGHDHNYERTYPIVSKAGKKPITYIVCGNGGTPLRYIGKREWTLYAERVFGFVLLNLDGTKLHFQAINVNGGVIDEFTLDKNDPQSVMAYEENKIFFEGIHDPVKASRYYAKGKKLKKQHKFAQAFEQYKKAYNTDSTCIQALAGMAACYFEFGKVDTAIQYALKAVQKKPNYPDSYEVLSEAYTSRKEYEHALEWCRKWLMVEPDSPDANEEMANIYMKQKKIDLAIAEMKKALIILPSDADLYFELGELYEAKGDQQAAVLSYKRGLDWFMDEEEDEDVKKVRAKVEKWIEGEKSEVTKTRM